MDLILGQEEVGQEDLGGQEGPEVGEAVPAVPLGNVEGAPQVPRDPETDLHLEWADSGNDHAPCPWGNRHEGPRPGGRPFPPQTSGRTVYSCVTAARTD